MHPNNVHSAADSGAATDHSSFRAREDDERRRRQRAVRSAIASLKRQRVDGASLAHLTLDRLLALGIAFGVAVDLMTCLDELPIVVPTRGVVETDEENAYINNNNERAAAAVVAGGGLLPSWYESDNEVVVVENNGFKSSIEGEGGWE